MAILGVAFSHRTLGSQLSPLYSYSASYANAKPLLAEDLGTSMGRAEGTSSCVYCDQIWQRLAEEELLGLSKQGGGQQRGDDSRCAQSCAKSTESP